MEEKGGKGRESKIEWEGGREEVGRVREEIKADKYSKNIAHG